jgi:hypothetical protein
MVTAGAWGPEPNSWRLAGEGPPQIHSATLSRPAAATIAATGDDRLADVARGRDRPAVEGQIASTARPTADSNSALPISPRRCSPTRLAQMASWHEAFTEGRSET